MTKKTGHNVDHLQQAPSKGDDPLQQSLVLRSESQWARDTVYALKDRLGTVIAVVAVFVAVVAVVAAVVV